MGLNTGQTREVGTPGEERLTGDKRAGIPRVPLPPFWAKGLFLPGVQMLYEVAAEAFAGVAQW